MATSAESAQKDRFADLKARLHLDQHSAAERMGVLLLVFAVLGAIFFTVTGATSLINNRVSIADTTIYTAGFTASKSGLKGDVSTVYRNTSGSRTMIMMKFDSGSMGSFSSDANQYQTFVTGIKTDLSDEALRQELKGDIVIFGTTGYMGIVIETADGSPVPSQLLNITVRANTQLAVAGDQSTSVLQSQKSFQEFDQWRLLINPGGNDAVIETSLDAVNVNPETIYSQTVLAPQEEAVRKQLDDQLLVLRTDLARIAEYDSSITRTNVDGVRIVPPAVPDQIAGDQIVGEEGALTLQTSYVSPKGYDFDWRSGSVTDGYLDEIVPEGESVVAFLARKAGTVKAADGSGLDEEVYTTPFRADTIEWKLTDGTDLKKDYAQSDMAIKPLTDLMSAQTQAYQTYYDDKMKYQEQDYAKLIDLEVQLRNVRSSASVNDSPSALTNY